MKCKICGKEFIPSRSTAAYCSSECRLESKNQCSKRYQEKHYIPKEPKYGDCVICGKSFPIRRGGSITCSPECRDARRKQKEQEKNQEPKTCICAYCGKEFQTLHITKYCGKECVNKARLERDRVDHPEKACKVCGTIFKPKNSRAEYCSKKCQKKLYGEKQARSYAVKSGIAIEYKHKPSKIDKIEKKARAKGLHYADLQKRETVDMYARVELPEWAVRR